MSLKRILENQLHLHDEGNPAWGMSGEYSGGYADQEAKDIARLVEAYKDVKPKTKEKMSFLKHVQEISKKYQSPKLDDIKTRIETSAMNGNKQMTLLYTLYDNNVIKWLQAEGFEVKETPDDRDGDFITIKW